MANNQIDDECLRSLGEFVNYNRHLERILLTSTRIRDNGIKILSEHLIGNTALKHIDLSLNNGITDAATPFLVEIGKKSCVTEIPIQDTGISYSKLLEIFKYLRISTQEREIPIQSEVKSAAKGSASS